MNRIPSTIAIILFPALFFVACGPDPAVRECRELRQGGDAAAARARALEALQENSLRLAVWREFALSTLEHARRLERDGVDSLEYLVEAALVCGAVYQVRRQNPPRPWREACRVVAAEVARQVNRNLSELQVQTDAARQIELLAGTVAGRPDSAAIVHRGQQLLQTYRDGARPLLIQAAVFGRLLEALPEVRSGSTAALSAQLTDALKAWEKALGLDPEFAQVVYKRARHTTDVALLRAADDLRELGSFVPLTIVENGVLP